MDAPAGSDLASEASHTALPDDPVRDPARPDDAGPADGAGPADDAGPLDGAGPSDTRPATFLDRVAARLARVQISSWITLVVVGACVLLVSSVLHPRLVLTDTIPTGGDMGAHVWGPAYLRDHLLTNGRLVGWTPDWYAGFPAFQFYMLIPSVVIVALNGFAVFAIAAALLTATLVVLAVRATDPERRRRLVTGAVFAGLVAVVCTIGMPYGVAFKVVAVSGLVAMPVCAWAMGRLAGMPYPAPALFAVATVPFLFDRSFNIYGGNIASTMAGEFHFSMSLSLSLLALGLAMRAMDTGRGRGWTALVFALAGLCHIFPAVWAAGLSGLYFLRRPTRQALVSLVTTLPVAGLLGAFWALPFYGKSTYLNDMGWEKIELFKSYLLTRNQLNPAETLRDSPPLEVVFGIAMVGLVLCIARRNRFGVVLGINVALIALLFIHMPQMRLWNARTLPFYYLSLYLLCALAVYEAVRLVVDKVWARWYLVYALSGLVLVEVARYAVEGSTWQIRLGRVLPGQYATTSGALLVAGLATLVSARRAGGRLVFAPVAGIIWMAATVVPDGWDTASGNAQFVDALQQAIAVILDVAQYAAAYGFVGLIVVEALDLITDTDFLAGRETGIVLRWSIAPVAFLAMWLVFGPALMKLPGGHLTADGKYRWGVDGFELTTTDRSYLPSWAEWNFRGIEQKRPTEASGGYPEYYDLVHMVEDVGAEYGCGRAMWEYGKRLDGYGTPMAPMLLPHFTDGCIGSMEGLFFEASSTTPFHFLNQSALSKDPSSAQRDLPYPGFDIDLGIEQLQLMGVRYYLAYTDTAVAAAEGHPDLQQIASGEDYPSNSPWRMYLVADTELVVPLDYSPVVYDGVDETQDEWLQPASKFFNDPTLYDVLRAASGPDEWPRYQIPETAKMSAAEVTDARAEAADRGEPFEEPVLPEAPRVELPEVQVSDITTTRDTIEFDVDQVGVPVLVKVSYFPNWKVDGADGPYRVTPNLMVVVPTDTHVRMHYGYTGIDYLAYALTFVGIVLLVVLFRVEKRHAPVRRPERDPGPAS